MVHKRTGYTIAILTVAVIFIGVGICFGGYADTYAKAVKVCLECIGIG